MNVLLASYGDPASSRTWSGVPSMIRKELISQGHRVVCGNLNSSITRRILEVVFNRFVRKVVRRFKRIPFSATRVGLWLSNKWLKRELKSRQEVDLGIATEFAVDCSGVTKKCVLLHDWTFGYSILRSPGETLTSKESDVESRLIKVMEQAELVVSLYPCARKYIADRCDRSGGVVFVCNPVNAFPLDEHEVSARMKYGSTSKRVLVIGDAAYKENVLSVVSAVEELKECDVVVDVIGCMIPNLATRFCKVVFHGYLDKSDERQYGIYRRLFLGARCLVNIRKAWGGGSSVAEALSCYLPVIIGRYPDIVALYGSKCKGVLYNEPGDVKELTANIERMLRIGAEEYCAMCKEVNALVRNDTYNRLVRAVTGQAEGVYNNGM